ncbi:MAG: hypothetical protein ABWZ42_00970 [Ilumatobacteraceae bacterium]
MADDVEPLALGGSDSPWAHDLPIVDPAPLPAAWTTAAVEPEESSPVDRLDRDTPVVPLGAPGEPDTPPVPADAPTPGHRHRRTAVVVGLAGLLAAAVIGSQLARGGDDTTLDDDESAATVTSASSTTEPSTPVVKVQTRNRLRPTTSVADRLPAPPPEWVTTNVALSPRVAAIAAPTQLVALGRDGTLHVIDTSTGAMHSIDTGMSAGSMTLSLGATNVLLSSYDRSDLTLARVGEPPTSVDFDGGVARVIDGSGTDDFILVPNTWTPRSSEVVRLGSDAQSVAVSTGPLAQYDPWQIQFLETTGQMIINDTGGVYLVDENGAATRISTGDLVFMGPNHFVLRECDGALACTYVRVDQATGQRDTVQLGALDQYRQWGDPSSWSLSPDGTGVSYFDWQNGGPLPARRLVDLTTGTNVQVESADQYNVESAWAADSSGIFVVADRTIVFYDRATGEQVLVAPDAGLDDIIAVATRPISG